MSLNGKNGHGEIKVIPMQEDFLPHSEEAETAVLGGIIIYQDAYYEVSDFLKPDHFYSTFHGEIYRAMGNLLAERMPIDLVTLGELLRARDAQPTKTTLDAYLVGLLNAVPTSLNTAHYGRIVHSAAIRRHTIQAGYKLRALANDANLPIDTLIEQAEEAVFGVAAGAITNRMQTIGDGLEELYDTVMTRRDNGGQVVGIPTGLMDLDNLLRGIKPSRLYILAGRPGMGKSMLANAFALTMSGKYGKTGAIFNLEMSSEEINTRFLANAAGIPLHQIEEGRLDDDELHRFQASLGKLSQFPLYIDDSTNLTPSQLRAKCRRIQAEHGLDFVIVDYLQLMIDDRQHGNREREISEISRQLKRLAKELHIPVIALAQLSRALESRADKRPVLSDLRESGDIENNADVVMFLYRDEYYDPDERPNIAEVRIAKNRNGKTGTADIYYNGALMRFSNLTRQPLNL